MLIQRAGSGTMPPPGFNSPDWSTLANQWRQIPLPPTPAVTLGPTRLSMGHDDSEADDITPHDPIEVVNHRFGWDNESPSRVVEVDGFRAEWRPITNREYEEYHARSNCSELPKSWIREDGENKVK